jgi:hypothetical protein
MDLNDEILEIFLKKGYIEPAGKNIAGDEVYRFTDLFYEEQAELVEFMRIQDSDILGSLWFKGYIDLMMDNDGLAHIYLNDKSDNWLDAKDLSEEEKSMMYLIYGTGSYIQGDYGES